jgi:hypothetical protein
MTMMLFLAGIALGCVIGEVDARRKRRGWKPYRRTDVMSEWRDG